MSKKSAQFKGEASWADRGLYSAGSDQRGFGAGMMRKHALANPSRPVMPAELPLEKSWRSVAGGDLENG
jgi:hypothetical protein